MLNPQPNSTEPSTQPKQLYHKTKSDTRYQMLAQMSSYIGIATLVGSVILYKDNIIDATTFGHVAAYSMLGFGIGMGYYFGSLSGGNQFSKVPDAEKKFSDLEQKISK